MKKITSFIMVIILMIGLVGCTPFRNSSLEKKFSFSGEIENVQVSKGIAIIGGKNEKFNGGQLKITDPNKTDFTKYEMTFYVLNGEERWTILSNKVEHLDDTIELKELEIGEITGQVLNTNMDENQFKENLYFELITTDEKGNTSTYTVPMEVKEEA